MSLTHIQLNNLSENDLEIINCLCSLSSNESFCTQTNNKPVIKKTRRNKKSLKINKIVSKNSNVPSYSHNNSMTYPHNNSMIYPHNNSITYPQSTIQLVNSPYQTINEYALTIPVLPGPKVLCGFVKDAPVKNTEEPIVQYGGQSPFRLVHNLVDENTPIKRKVQIYEIDSSSSESDSSDYDYLDSSDSDSKKY